MTDETIPIDERARIIKDNFNSVPFSATFGMALSFDASNAYRATINMPYNPDFDHSRGIHGSVLMTLLDTAGWCSAAVHYDTRVVTHEVHTYFLEGVAEEDITGTARLVRKGRRLALTDMEVHSASGCLLARATGSYMITKQPFTLPKE